MSMKVQNILRETGKVEFEGVTVRYEGEWQDLAFGDTYMAERNRGPRLLTVRKVDTDIGCVFPKECREYPYDLGECVKVSIKL